MIASIRPDPFAHYAALRRDAPVCYQAGADVWLVSRHADVLAVLRDSRRYSAIALGAESLEIRSPDDGRPLPREETLLASDPPVHTRLRRYLEPALGAGRLPGYGRVARAALDVALEKIGPIGRCDVVSAICQPVGAAVLAEVFGPSPQRIVDVARWMRIFSACNARSLDETTKAALERAHDEIWAAVSASRGTDAPGLLGSLARAHASGDLDAARAVDLCGTLLQGSADTTSHLIGNALLALHASPGALASLRAHPERMPAFVEESLRYDAPVQMTIRTTTEAVELGGVPVPAGARILVLLGSANRDEAVFEDGSLLDVERAPKRHLAFSAGAHRCPGAALARMQARAVLDALVLDLDELHIDVGSLVCAEQAALRGPDRLEITFTRFQRGPR